MLLIASPGLAAFAVFLYWGAHDGGYAVTAWLPGALLLLGATRGNALGFVGAMLESMFAGIKTNKMFGGGSAEDMYRSLMTQEYGKAVAARGTLGIADTIKREMLRMQEAH